MRYRGGRRAPERFALSYVTVDLVLAYLPLRAGSRRPVHMEGPSRRRAGRATPPVSAGGRCGLPRGGTVGGSGAVRPGSA
ncbi:hypothetical protein GCM10010466_34280 [Planomonospora alba]|uniref:Uncharacterized protein n=1 Tax=Planomonospora alba TaxID=161354 RepID=A0ABP6N8Z9_9ACTN